MELTLREKRIIQILIRNEFCKTEEIAAALGLSKRTVQREINGLKPWLKKHNLFIANVKGTGLELQGDLSVLSQFLDNTSEYDETDKNSRRQRLLFILLKDRVPHKMHYYSSLLNVSENTINSDLSYLEPILTKHNLSICKRPGFGVSLTGTEKDYRNVLQQLIMLNINANITSSIPYRSGYMLADAIMDSAGSNAYDLLNSNVLTKVSLILHNIDDKRLLEMSATAYIGLLIHIAIAMQRLLQDQVVNDEATSVNHCELTGSSQDYDLAVLIKNRLEKEFQIRLPNVELDYILLHITGSKLQYDDKTGLEAEKAYNEDILDLIEKMIFTFDIDEEAELKLDEDLVRGLLVHMQPTLIRLTNGMSINNPLLDEIKNEYHEVYCKCQRVAKLIENETGLVVNDAEIGYLTAHFGAAEVRLKHNRLYQRTVNLGVVCASGFGIARLMLSKLSDKLGDAVTLKAVSRDDICTAECADIDFYVTTVYLNDLNVDYITVSPLITANDLENIYVKISEYSHIIKKNNDIDFIQELDQVTYVSQTIKSILERYKNIKVPANTTFEEALKIISLKTTKGPNKAKLLYQNFMEREAMSSQVLSQFNLVLLHCTTEAVEEPSVYTVTPEDNDRFKNEYFQNTKVILVMLVPKLSKHRKMYTELLGEISREIAENCNFLKILASADEEKNRKSLAVILKRHFDSYLRKST